MRARSSTEKTKITFHHKLVNIDVDVDVLYRGFSDMPEMIFNMPTILGGLFGRHYPEQVTIWDVNNHKTTNISKEYYFDAMTTSLGVATNRGNGSFITIDPTLFRHHIIDVNKSYRESSLNMPARMVDEDEQVALAIPYCAIKSIHFQSEVIQNPFYITADTHATEDDFSHLYRSYIDLLHDKFNHLLTDHEEQRRLIEFVGAYLEFYAKFTCDSNPFNLSPRDFSSKFPAYHQQFLTHNPSVLTPILFQKQETIGEMALMMAAKIFTMHDYCQEIPEQKAECVSVYDDPYASPFYE